MSLSACLVLACMGIIAAQLFTEILPMGLAGNIYLTFALVGAVLAGANIALYIWAVALRGRTWSWGGTDPRKVRGHFLCELGPYRIVRHPAYAGGILGVLGFELVVSSWLVFVIVPIFTLFLIKLARQEDRDLATLYPVEHAEYRQRVPWLILPWLH